MEAGGRRRAPCSSSSADERQSIETFSCTARRRAFDWSWPALSGVAIVVPGRERRKVPRQTSRRGWPATGAVSVRHANAGIIAPLLCPRRVEPVSRLPDPAQETTTRPQMPSEVDGRLDGRLRLDWWASVVDGLQPRIFPASSSSTHPWAAGTSSIQRLVGFQFETPYDRPVLGGPRPYRSCPWAAQSCFGWGMAPKSREELQVCRRRTRPSAQSLSRNRDVRGNRGDPSASTSAPMRSIRSDGRGISASQS